MKKSLFAVFFVVVVVFLFGGAVGQIFAQAAEASAATQGHLYMQAEAGSSTYTFNYGQCRVEIEWINPGIVGKKVFGTARWSVLPAPAQISVHEGNVGISPAGGTIGWSFLPKFMGTTLVSIDNGHAPECLYTVGVGAYFAAHKVHIEVKAFWSDDWRQIVCAGNGCGYKIGDKSGDRFPDEFVLEGIPNTTSLGEYKVDFTKTSGPFGAKLISANPEAVEVNTNMVFCLIFERPLKMWRQQ